MSFFIKKEEGNFWVMKKLLILLSSIALTTSTVTPITVFFTKNQAVDGYVADSFQNLVKILNTKYTSREVLEKNNQINQIIDGLVPEYYENSFNGTENGVFRSWEMEPLDDEQILWTFNDTFRNDSQYEQIYNTESYSKTITNSHTFSISLSEKISETTAIKSKFKVPFIKSGVEVGVEIGIEIGSNQEWSDTVEETVTITAPSQTIKTSPYSILDVMYVIKQGVYNSTAIINYEVEDIDAKTFKIPRFYFTDDGEFVNTVWEMLSVSDIIETLTEIGSLDQFKNSSHRYSILTVDNAEHPNKIYLNLPVSWQSQGGQIQVSHHEKSI